MKFKNIQDAMQYVALEIGREACEYVAPDADISVESCYYDDKDNTLICHIIGSTENRNYGAYSFDGDYFHVDIRVEDSYEGDYQSMECVVVLFVWQLADVDLNSPKRKNI